MTTEERRQRLRDDLVDAAERSVTERGLAGLKARELAREVKCAVGAIYTVFPDLDALILAVNSRTLALLEARLAAAGAEDLAPEASLVALATAYLDFAADHRQRWRTIFAHRLPEGQAVPDWHLAEQLRLFSYIEKPLGALRPEAAPMTRALIARSLFSAVHGIVALGLEEKLLVLPLPVLREQVAFVVGCLGHGLRSGLDATARDD